MTFGIASRSGNLLDEGPDPRWLLNAPGQATHRQGGYDKTALIHYRTITSAPAHMQEQRLVFPARWLARGYRRG